MARDERGDPTPLADLLSLRGKRALITGSASGIGAAMARRFAQAGADLELVDIDEDGLREVQAELGTFHVKLATHQVDLSRREEIRRLWESLRGREPDILVNNAGVYPMKDFLEVDPAFLQKVSDINLNAVFWMCQEMIRSRGAKGGVIINVGSIEALLPFKDDLAHYSMSKAGVLALTRALAKDYGKDFRVNALVPGGILTEGTRHVALDVLKLNLGIVKAGVEFRTRLPIGRFGHPDEVALMALVLASDLASYVQGALIPVDGGFLSA